MASNTNAVGGFTWRVPPNLPYSHMIWIGLSELLTGCYRLRDKSDVMTMIIW